jgi:cysteine synthase A
MGTGLAIVCGIRGYPFIAVMSKGNSEERARMMRALGAEVVLVDQLARLDARTGLGRRSRTRRPRGEANHKSARAFRADQFHRDGNWLAHYRTTGAELWEQSGATIDAFVDFIGSGGSYVGVTKALKERSPSVRCYVVEPAGAAAAAGETVTRPDHPIQGGGYAMADLAFLKDVPVDGYRAGDRRRCARDDAAAGAP